MALKCIEKKKRIWKIKEFSKVCKSSVLEISQKFSSWKVYLKLYLNLIWFIIEFGFEKKIEKEKLSLPLPPTRPSSMAGGLLCSPSFLRGPFSSLCGPFHSLRIRPAQAVQRPSRTARSRPTFLNASRALRSLSLTMRPHLLVPSPSSRRRRVGLYPDMEAQHRHIPVPCRACQAARPLKYWAPAPHRLPQP